MYKFEIRTPTYTITKPSGRKVTQEHQFDRVVLVSEDGQSELEEMAIVGRFPGAPIILQTEVSEVEKQQITDLVRNRECDGKQGQVRAAPAVVEDDTPAASE